MDFQFPFQFDGDGQTATANREDHVYQMIEQVLFTNPGERLNRPDFGSGILQLIFTPNSDQLAATVEASILGALQRWLGDVISIQDLSVRSQDSNLSIAVAYQVLETGEERLDNFERSVAS